MGGSSKRRFGSSSSQTSQNSGDICRICHCESEAQNPLLTPCYCSGSLKFVHQSCLQQWLTASETNSCELCKFPFIMHTKIKPFNEWRALQMSGIERRRLFCSVLFHCAAATCVIWSLCVLIERATEEVKRGQISWPFWTKLVVVTVGLTGGLVFMYIQCKAYLSLCTRWRARNRILLIQNAPEKVAPPPQQPHHHQMELRDSPPLMFNRTAMSGGGVGGGTSLSNASGMGTQVSTMALNRSVYSAASHGQIVANIESNSGSHGGSSRQSRDWTNVHVEDMVYHSDLDEGEEEDQQQQQHQQRFRCVDEMSAGASAHHSTDLNGMYRVHNHPLSSSSSSQQQQQQTYSDNHEMLGDTTMGSHMSMMGNSGRHMFDEHGRSKFNRQRHSLWVDSNSGGGGGGVCESSSAAAAAGLMMMANNSNNQSEVRRYSDTRLIMEPDDEEYQQQQLQQRHQIFNVAQALAPPIGYGVMQTGGNSGLVALDGRSGRGSAIELEDSPQITDILFDSTENGSSFDPLELNIQELLELDIRTNVRAAAAAAAGATGATPAGMATTACVENEFRSSQLSVNSDPQKYARATAAGTMTAVEGGQRTAEQKQLVAPQSLPNLSASCENLLKQQD